jgi:hypothetical protein
LGISKSFTVEIKFMAIFAYSETALAHFTDLLHDLYFALPGENFVPQAGVISIQLFDKDRILRKEVVSQFRCSIHEVTSCEMKGDPRRCPDPIFFNVFKYSRTKGLLVLKACSPVQIKFHVKNLHLELEQLT